MCFTDLLAEYIENIRPLLDRPFAFFGHSLGGLFAFECTRMINDLGLRRPDHLFIGSCPAPSLPIEKFSDQSDDILITHLKEMDHSQKNVLDNPRFRELILRILRADLEVRESYHYLDNPKIDTPITVFIAPDDAYVPLDTVRHWKNQTTADCNIKKLSGGHFFSGATHTLLSAISKTIKGYLNNDS